MRKLFGTDGIRGRADEFPLDSATMFALGEALAHRLRKSGKESPVVLLGSDTRESAPRIAGDLASGVSAGGGEARLVGIVPTPGVAWSCRSSGADAAISISASHNPYQDNGVKIFGSDGMKLADAIELEIENELMEIRRDQTPPATYSARDAGDLVERYEEFLVGAIPPRALDGKRVVLDAGHGAAFQIARRVFERAGASVRMIHDAPDGRNINLESGALHPERLAAVVVEEGADFGVAFDGDADRAIFADDRGRIRNGDEILYLWALDLERAGRLRGETVVATVMSNLGFERRLAEEGIRLLRASVGDKYVLEMMLENGAVLGGEQSGHIIDLEVHTTGDGIHTALVVGALLARTARPFSEIPTFVPLPQVLLN
ncbi:MAG TPA: phosphoglucosamine mutase, partial [Thermoanaerobaculia bacterium]|nr:phosphoglucosamine mutase [Thermoanaerobaculia bacterium]